MTFCKTDEFFKEVAQQEEIPEFGAMFFHYQNFMHLYEHTSKTVASSFDVSTTGFSIKKEGFTLFPSLTTSCYCLASIFFDYTFNQIFSSSKSNSYGSWYRENSHEFNNLDNKNDQRTLFNAYIASQFRHKVIVHSESSETPGHSASSSGDFQLWYATGHILNRDSVIPMLKKIKNDVDNLDDKYLETTEGLHSCKYVLREIENEGFNDSYAIENTFERCPYLKDTPLQEIRGKIEEIVNKYGCNSQKLSHIAKTVDEFLPVMWKSKKLFVK